jgi:RNA-directed DNA polymerase
MMHGHEKSDSNIVAVKPANKAEQPSSEQSAKAPTAAGSVEPRTETGGNAGQQSTHRAQNRASVTQALDRIRTVARERKKERTLKPPTASHATLWCKRLAMPCCPNMRSS